MSSERTPLAFKGDGMDFFALILKNMLLTLCTFGIYHFWAKIDVQKFLSRHTFFNDESFDFHGTGGEKFKGFLKAAAVFLALFVVAFLISHFLGKAIGEKTGKAIMLIIVYGVIILLTPMIIVGKRRYFLSRSSWRGVRFVFTGRWKKLALLLLKGGFLSIVTLGIYIPWFIHDYRAFIINHSSFGTEKFTYSGDRITYVKLVWIGLLISIFTLGIFSFWVTAAIERHFMNNTTIQKKSLSCNLTGGQLLKLALTNILIFIFSLGWGASWIVMRTYRVLLGSIALEGMLDFEAIKAAVDTKASAFADGLTDAADALDSLADFIV
jgi:uncharacterized membrane protein YjgN (DUF898 family)